MGKENVLEKYKPSKTRLKRKGKKIVIRANILN